MVELRRRTQLSSQTHYIRAIKDGSIKIVLNTIARGKSKLRFRRLVDIYHREHSKDDESIPRVVRDLENVSDMPQSSSLFGAEDNDIKPVADDFNMITLQKIRKQCKGKKRKLRNRGDAVTFSNVEVKKEYVTQDEGCDIEKPLSSCDTKFAKRRKKNQKRKVKSSCSSFSSPSVENVDLPVFFDVKPEAWDGSYSFSEAMDLIPTDHFPDCNKDSVLVEERMFDSSRDMRLVPYCNKESVLVEERMFDSSSDMRLVPYCNKDSVWVEERMFDSSRDMRLVPYCSADPITTDPEEEAFEDASEELNDASKALCCDAENKEIVLYCNEYRGDFELDFPPHSESETYSGNEEVEEGEESNGSNPHFGMNITGLEMVKIEAPEAFATDYSSLPIVDFGEESTEIVWETEDISKDYLPQAADILRLTNCCDSPDSLQPVPDNSTVSLEEDQLPENLSSEHEDEAGEDRSSQLYKAPDEVQNAAETDSFQLHKLHHQPEKLLSGRKAFSPTSQAKLRKAMEHPDSPEKKSKKAKGRLYFGSQHSHRILKAEGLDNINRVGVIPSSKQVIRKANNITRQTQHQRATHKFSRRDAQAAKAQPFSTGRASIQGCSQKAIAFSQGQMHDFQYMAAKLTNELKTMRQITKRCLLGEISTSNMSECNLDEVKTLIGHAEKTEEGSRKWLSILERNCNRFCKLMSMVREDPPATENIVQREKKIKFADDAGGDLCHVKFFEIDLESES